MKKFLVFLYAFLFSLEIISAEGEIPLIQFSLNRNELIAIIALVIALVLALIYWILQSRYSN